MKPYFIVIEVNKDKNEDPLVLYFDTWEQANEVLSAMNLVRENSELGSILMGETECPEMD